MTDNEATLKAITQVLRRHLWVRAAWVFGSMADGRVRPGSDLDVAVLGDRPLQAEQKSILIRRLARAIGRPVDLVDLQAAHGPVVGEILRHGKRLFCDDPALYAEQVKQWMFDRADWIPYRQRILETRRRAWINES
jgi:predicted nucleotidyltransferase